MSRDRSVFGSTSYSRRRVCYLYRLGESGVSGAGPVRAGNPAALAGRGAAARRRAAERSSASVPGAGSAHRQFAHGARPDRRCSRRCTTPIVARLWSDLLRVTADHLCRSWASSDTPTLSNAESDPRAASSRRRCRRTDFSRFPSPTTIDAAADDADAAAMVSVDVETSCSSMGSCGSSDRGVSAGTSGNTCSSGSGNGAKPRRRRRCPPNVMREYRPPVNNAVRGCASSDPATVSECDSAALDGSEAADLPQDGTYPGRASLCHWAKITLTTRLKIHS